MSLHLADFSKFNQTMACKVSMSLSSTTHRQLWEIQRPIQPKNICWTPWQIRMHNGFVDHYQPLLELNKCSLWLIDNINKSSSQKLLIVELVINYQSNYQPLFEPLKTVLDNSWLFTVTFVQKASAVHRSHILASSSSHRGEPVRVRQWKCPRTCCFLPRRMMMTNQWSING